MSLQQQPWPLPTVHILDAEVARYVSSGWAVESQSETMAVMVAGGQPNHVLHLLVTLITCGLWALVWFLIAATSRKHRVSLVVNPDGTVAMTKY